MKVRDVIKRVEQDGWRLFEPKAATANIIILRSRERLQSRDIRHWTFHQER
jgi:predicted RNA binding protein YcfA (HicA-like mRNA interferase family)